MEADLKYFYAAYRQNVFPLVSGLSPAEFSDQIRNFLTSFPAEWVFDAPTKNGIIPVGVGLAANVLDEIIIIGKIIWFPWASLRNKLESALNLIEASRQENTLLDFADESDQPFYVRLCKYGSVRRVGTLYMLDGTKIAQYQSKP